VKSHTGFQTLPNWCSPLPITCIPKSICKY
jgi:hypothetical protein